MTIPQVNHLLELLYDRGDGYFVSDELTAAIGVDRTRLEKLIELLGHRGHALERNPARGVRLASPIRLDAHLIERELGTRRIGKHVICFDELDSTNDVAFDSARQAEADGLVVLAESQRRGRGRMGRKWLSRPRSNILLSALLLDPGKNLSQDALTIAGGLAVAEGIEAVGVHDVKLKWPNDVLLETRKVAGVLVEVRTVERNRAVVIGIGVNVGAHPHQELLDSPATDLVSELGHDVRRIEVIRKILQRLDEWVYRISEGKLEELRTAWLRRCGMLNERISVACGDVRHVGWLLDVSPLEGLILSTDDGRRIYLQAGSSRIL